MPPIDTENEPDDLRATIAAQFEAAENSDGSTLPDTGPEEPPSDEPLTAPKGATSDGTPSNDGRQRNPDGTFAKKTDDAPDKAAPVAEKSAPEIPSKDAAKASEPVASTPTVAPPAGWTAAEKAEWSKLPPAVQAAVSRRENEMARGGQQWSEEKRRFEAVLSPVAREASRLGMGVDQALNALMSAHHSLQSNAPAALRQLAQQYGVDLATLAGQPSDGSPEQIQQQPTAPPQQQSYRDPRVDALWEANERQRTEGERRTVDLVTQFAASPGHEHFDAVQDELMSLIPTIRAANPTFTSEKTLQEAYDRAVYANPTTRASTLAAKEQSAEAERQKAAAERATKARRAGSSVTGSPSGMPAMVPKDSLRAEIEAAMAG